MAGIKNRAAAEEILSILPRDSPFKGVCYFDQEQDLFCIMNKDRKVTPRGRSPIKESETIVYFDESHCRGTDMQLLPDAHGVLTVGPKMLKDKLIQAAGRMRQLHLHQTIEFLGSTEASMQIRALIKPPTPDVLAPVPSTTLSVAPPNPPLPSESPAVIDSTLLLIWLLDNTAKNTKEGLLEWAIHGMIFAGVQELPAKATLPEDTKLETLYKDPVRFQKIQETFIQQRIIYNKLFDGKLEGNDLVQKIQIRVEEYGVDKESSSMAFSQECERELMKTVQRQEEQERQYEKKSPRAEVDINDWEVLLSSKYTCAKTEALAIQTFLEKNSCLGDWKQVFGGSKFDTFQWKKNIYWTTNFIETLDHNTSPNYLRQIDCFLVCSSLFAPIAQSRDPSSRPSFLI